MLGGWEFLILALVVVLFFGYKRLPEIGRSAGEGARQLKEAAVEKGSSARAAIEEKGPEAQAKLEQRAASAREYAGEKTETAKAYVSEHTPTAKDMGRTAGKHVREYRELKEEIMSVPESAKPGKPEPGSEKPASG